MDGERGFAEPEPITDPDATTRITACVWFPDKWVTRALDCGIYVLEFRTSDGEWHSFSLSDADVRGISAAFATKLFMGI